MNHQMLEPKRRGRPVSLKVNSSETRHDGLDSEAESNDANIA